MDAGILPEVYRKVLTAKKYLATGKAASVKEAAQLAGISRSAYYKYKDAPGRGGGCDRDRAHCRSVCGACPFTGAFGAVERCCWRRIYSVNL